MARRLKIPLKYKFLGVLMFIMLLGFSTFFTLAYHTFSEDKKLFVMELNLSLLKTAMSDVKADLKSRLDELQAFIPKVYQPSASATADAFRGLNVQHLPEELLGVTFFRHKLDDNKYEILKQYKNSDLIQKKNLTSDSLAIIEKNHPAPLANFVFDEGMQLINRSLMTGPKGAEQEVSVLSILIPGNFVNDESKSIVIVVDLLQDFIRKKLQQSEIAEIFLISKKGLLLSHSSPTALIQYANTPYDHPIVERLQTKQFPRESLELQVNEEAYLCNLAETGLTDVYAVSQIKQSEAFVALKTLMRQTLLTGAFILSIALIFSIIFANRLTQNIQKLKMAAENIGRGNFDNVLDIQSNDEVQNVAESFRWMSNRITELIEESAKKARMEDELETAKLVQDTLLTPPSINSDAVEIAPYYLAASECGGDVWDAFLTDDILTLVIGDATGHGAPAAIVTAVAKSCLSTLNGVYAGHALAPEQFLEQLNAVVYASCKGQLLMTMCMLQLDLRTGELLVCNAGHESPMCLRAEDPSTASDGEKKKGNCEVFFARGERLGFSPDSKYESVKVQLQINDSVLLYTDGISEAINAEGKQWGERAVKKVFSKAGQRPLEKIRDDLVSGVKEFMGGANQADDITFVLLQWKKIVEGKARVRSQLVPKAMTEGKFTTRIAVVEESPAQAERLTIPEISKEEAPTIVEALPMTQVAPVVLEEPIAPMQNLLLAKPEVVEPVNSHEHALADLMMKGITGNFDLKSQAEPTQINHFEDVSHFDPPADFSHDLGELATPMVEGEFCELPIQFGNSDYCELPMDGSEIEFHESPTQDEAKEKLETNHESAPDANSLLALFTVAMEQAPKTESETVTVVPPPELLKTQAESQPREETQTAVTQPNLRTDNEVQALPTQSAIETLVKTEENADENLDRNYSRLEEIDEWQKNSSGGGSDDEAA